MRVAVADANAVENMAYNKESWISNRRHVKRHVRPQWKHSHAGRAVDGAADSSLDTCTVLDNFDVDRPVWMVKLGKKVKIAGVVILTWLGRRDQPAGQSVIADQIHCLDRGRTQRFESFLI